METNNKIFFFCCKMGRELIPPASLIIICDIDERSSTKGEPWKKTHPAEACDRNEPRGGAAHPVAERQQGHPRCRSRFAAPFARRRRWRLLELLAALPAGSPPPPCSVRLLFTSLGLTRLPGERRRACRAIPSRRSHTCPSRPRPEHRSTRRRPVFLPYDLSLSRVQIASPFSVSRDR